MTRTEFRLQAYLTCLDAVTREVLKDGYSRGSARETAETISLIADSIADESVKAMSQHLPPAGE